MRKRKVKTSKTSTEVKENKSEDLKKSVYKTIICNFIGFVCVIIAYYFKTYLEPNLTTDLCMTICSLTIVVLISFIYVLFNKL